MVVVIFALILIATATWLFLNNFAFNQINKVQITAFSIYPKGWENPSAQLLTCSFNITLQNMGINEVKELKLEVIMYINGSEILVRNNIFDVDEGWINNTIFPGEAKSF